MLKTFKYRLYPTADQCKLIDQTISVCRLVYNLALQVNIYTYQAVGRRMSSYDLMKQLPDLRNEYEWIRIVPSQALQASISRIDFAFKSFIKGNNKFPKFKKKSIGGKFLCQAQENKINYDFSTLSVSKIKNIPIRISINPIGKMRQITIIKSATGKYFASVLVETKEQKILKPKRINVQKVIGIDVGIKDFIATSNGKKFDNPRFLKKELEKLKYLQKQTSKKQKKSNNRKKANLKVAKLHEKITNKRLDYIHKITHALTNDNQVNSIAIEDLNVSGLLKNHKLAQAISDVSWSEFFRQLQYKCDWNGKNLIKIGRFEPSTKICNNCKEINQTLTLSDREWVCSSCGVLHDRDINAAKNIRLLGIVKLIKQYSGSDRSGELVE